MRTHRLMWVAFLAASLVGCPHAPGDLDEEEDPGGMYIEFGWSYMALDHTREMAKLRMDDPAFWKPRMEDAALDKRNHPAELARTLRETVWEYNAQSSSLCADGLYVELSCLPPLNPPWLYESSLASPSFKELRKRESLVEDRVGALWDAACADFRARNPRAVGEEYMQYCSIE